MSLELIDSVRSALQSKTKGFRVFYNSGLNVSDTRTGWSNLKEEERPLFVKLYNETFKPSTPIKDISEASQENLLAMYNALYETASNVTAIANAYSGSPDIVALLHRNPIEEDEIQISVDNSGNDHIVTVKLNKSDKYEVSQICRRSYWPKNRRDGIYGQSIRNSYSPIEFLTVLSVNSDGSNHQILTRNFEVRANYSFIVSSQGEIKRQKYGEMDKFIDDDGVDHRATL